MSCVGAHPRALLPGCAEVESLVTMMRLAGYTLGGQGVGKVFRGRRGLREEEELPRCVRAAGAFWQSFCLEVVKQN